jgi:hypothetical protein
VVERKCIEVDVQARARKLDISFGWTPYFRHLINNVRRKWLTTVGSNWAAQ